MKVFGGVRESAKSAKGAHLPDELKPLALRYALGLPGVAGVAVGLHDEEELRRTLDWVRAYSPPTADELMAHETFTRGLASEWGALYGPQT